MNHRRAVSTGTKDSDALQTVDRVPATKDRLLALGGAGTEVSVFRSKV